jgi:glycerol-3-phosphate acyltransferase PlsY
LGSIPTAYIAGRLLKNIDIRKFGSGNVGATNALRILGKKAGICVLLFDALKGALAVTFLSDFVLMQVPVLSNDILRIILGISCIFGHNWTVFLRFKGGKGVATTFGVLIGLSFKIPGLGAVLSLVFLSWLAVFLVTRLVSLASMLCCAAMPAFMVLFKQSVPLIIFSLLIAIFIAYRHRSNLIRIFQGKEPRLYFKK